MVHPSFTNSNGIIAVVFNVPFSSKPANGKKYIHPNGTQQTTNASTITKFSKGRYCSNSGRLFGESVLDETSWTQGYKINLTKQHHKSFLDIIFIYYTLCQYIWKCCRSTFLWEYAYKEQVGSHHKYSRDQSTNYTNIPDISNLNRITFVPRGQATMNQYGTLLLSKQYLNLRHDDIANDYNIMF